MTSIGWQECKLGELLEIKHGYAFKGEFFGTAGSHIVLTPGNFFEKGGFRDKGDDEKWYAGPILSEYVLEQGDIVIAMTEQSEGLLGSSAIIPRGGLYLHNQRIGLVKLRRGSPSDSRFIYYLFNTRAVRAQIRASASGAKIRHTAPSRIADVTVLAPPPGEQHRIAEILAAYDELIANNLRRIRILEEIACAIYREWFFHFRFPGHRSVPLVDSPLGAIPEGWRAMRLGEVLELLYGKGLRQEDRHEGEIPVYGSSGVVGHHDSELIKGPGVILGRKGNVGSVHWSDGNFWPIDTVYYVSSELPLRFLYWDLQFKQFLNSDAAVPGLSRRQAYALVTVVPSKPLIERFAEQAESLGQLSSALEKQVSVLRATRDLLLPRLMSGRLSLATVEAAV